MPKEVYELSVYVDQNSWYTWDGEILRLRSETRMENNEIASVVSFSRRMHLKIWHAVHLTVHTVCAYRQYVALDSASYKVVQKFAVETVSGRYFSK